MMWVSIDSGAYIAEILDDSASSHSNAHNFRYLKSFPRALCLRKVVVGSIQKFRVISTQRSFPRESCKPNYFLVPFRKEYVNEPSPC